MEEVSTKKVFNFSKLNLYCEHLKPWSQSMQIFKLNICWKSLKLFSHRSETFYSGDLDSEIWNYEVVAVQILKIKDL